MHHEALLWLHDSISLPFLVDSSADDSFIDHDFAKQANLAIKTLSKQKTILDGKTFAKWIHHTAPLTLNISGNHR